MDIKTMKEYLKCAVELERYVYIWNNALNNVNRSIGKIRANKQNAQNEIVAKEVEYSRVESEVMNERKEDKQDTRLFSGLLIPIGIIFMTLVYGGPFLIGAFEEMDNHNVSFLEGLKLYIDRDLGAAGTIIVALVAVVAVVSLIAEIIMIIKAFLQKEKTGYWNKEIKKRKLVAQKEKENLNRAIAVLDSKERELTETKNSILINLRKASEELALLYAKNYLPSKYRDMVAVSTMYEYLATGRCTEVEGHGGMIDTYEYDCKFGMIINNLVEINKNLDLIAANQQMLHNELCMANSYLKNIQSDISNIESHTAGIEKNTAISAVANQQTAAVLRSMEWRSWASGC